MPSVQLPYCSILTIVATSLKNPLLFLESLIQSPNRSAKAVIVRTHFQLTQSFNFLHYFPSQQILPPYLHNLSNQCY